MGHHPLEIVGMVECPLWLAHGVTASGEGNVQRKSWAMSSRMDCGETESRAGEGRGEGWGCVAGRAPTPGDEMWLASCAQHKRKRGPVD